MNKQQDTKNLTLTERVKIKIAFQDAKDMGEDFETALDWAADKLTDERDGDNTWQSIAIWVQIREIGEDVWWA